VRLPWTRRQSLVAECSTCKGRSCRSMRSSVQSVATFEQEHLDRKQPEDYRHWRGRRLLRPDPFGRRDEDRVPREVSSSTQGSSYPPRRPGERPARSCVARHDRISVGEFNAFRRLRPWNRLVTAIAAHRPNCGAIVFLILSLAVSRPRMSERLQRPPGIVGGWTRVPPTLISLYTVDTDAKKWRRRAAARSCGWRIRGLSIRPSNVPGRRGKVYRGEDRRYRDGRDRRACADSEFVVFVPGTKVGDEVRSAITKRPPSHGPSGGKSFARNAPARARPTR